MNRYNYQEHHSFFNNPNTQIKTIYLGLAVDFSIGSSFGVQVLQIMSKTMSRQFLTRTISSGMLPGDRFVVQASRGNVVCVYVPKKEKKKKKE
jgi:hypothetical protein